MEAELSTLRIQSAEARSAMLSARSTKKSEQDRIDKAVAAAMSARNKEIMADMEKLKTEKEAAEVVAANAQTAMIEFQQDNYCLKTKLS